MQIDGSDHVTFGTGGCFARRKGTITRKIPFYGASQKSQEEFLWLEHVASQLDSESARGGTRCLIHRIEPILQHTENGGVSRWQGAKSRRPPSGTRHSTREVLSGFSGAFKCFRSCLECHKRLLETEEETGFLIGPRRNPLPPRASTTLLGGRLWPFFFFRSCLAACPVRSFFFLHRRRPTIMIAVNFSRNLFFSIRM